MMTPLMQGFWKRKLSEALLTCLLPDELRRLREDINRLLASGYKVRMFE
jgi:hypothetical protein